MVCINSRKQKGSGVIDTLMKPFTVSKYGYEAHARSLDPNHFLTGYRFVGPRTELTLRKELHDDVPLNDLDETAKEHDYAYKKEKEEYMKDHDKSRHMKNIWHSDDVFIQKSKNSHDDPIVGNIASKLIQTKENLEKHQLMDTARFSGMGSEESSDPVQRLRDLVKHQYKVQEKHNNKKQKGGFLIPLIPLATAALTALVTKAVPDIYDFVKKRLTGGGYKLKHHKTIKDKKDFLKEIVNQL